MKGLFEGDEKMTRKRETEKDLRHGEVTREKGRYKGGKREIKEIKEIERENEGDRGERIRETKEGAREKDRIKEIRGKREIT